MSDENAANRGDSELLPPERARIRAEMRYALLAVQESRPPERSKSTLDKAIGYLSNGFVILIIGSIITAGIVPRFQRQYESRKQQVILMREGLAQFLAYSNSIWQEYYAILPLTQEAEITKEKYIEYLQMIAKVKLQRYDAYAKVQALTVVYGDDPTAKGPAIAAALREYAISLNSASAAIDSWLRNLYCTPTQREQSPCATFDPEFDSFGEYEKIKQLVVDIGNKETENVASLMVRRISQY